MAGPGRAESDDGEQALLPRGVLASAAIAVRVAWARRRPLFVVVACALSPLLAVDAVARVVASGGDAAIVADELVHPLSGGEPTILVPVLVFLAWCVALGAAVVVAGAGLLGVEPVAGGALRSAARALPTTMFLPVFMAFGFFWSLVSGAALWVILVGAGALLLVHAIGGEDSWVFLLLAAALAFVGVIVPLARALARWALVVPAAVLSGLHGRAAFARARELVRQDEPAARGDERPGEAEPARTARSPDQWADDRVRMLLLPGLLMLVGVLMWVGESRARTADAWSSGLVDATLVAIVMLQAATLVLVFLRRRRDGDEARAVDLDAVRARLPAPAGRSRWGWLAAALVLLPLPTAVAEATVAVNPYGVPRWTLAESNLDGGVRTAAWPAGQHPIVVTDAHVVDCLDDGCGRQARWGSSVVPVSVVTVSADGTVVIAGVSRPEGGRDVVRLDRCTRAGDCTRAEVDWPSDPAGGQPLVAAAATGSGALLVAAARRGAGPQTELTLTSCAEWTCVHPRVTVLGTVAEPAPAGAEGRTPYGRGPLDVRPRPDGTAEVIYRGHHGRAATPVVCAPRCAPVPAAAADALALSADSSYALLADAGPEPDEVFGPLGAATPTPVQLAVARCARPGCGAVDRRWRLNIVDRPGATLDGLLVVTPDGRAVVVQATDRMSVATATLPA